MTDAQERRDPATERVKVATLVEICGNIPGIPVFEAESVDVSARGMHLRTAYLPEAGAPLVCRFESDGREIVVEGTVKQVVFIAPHSIVYLDVKDDKGESAIWALEATAPAGIYGNGVGRQDVRAGDPIKARCHQLRDGANGCLLGFITPMHGDAARGNGIEREWD